MFLEQYLHSDLHSIQILHSFAQTHVSLTPAELTLVAPSYADKQREHAKQRPLFPGLLQILQKLRHNP